MATLTDWRPEPMIQRFNDWLEGFEPFGRMGRTQLDHFIRVEETMTDGTLQIRAELPGVDPAQDIDISVADGLLTITAERREETERDDGDQHFSEFRYGSFRRSLHVPRDLDPARVSATYDNGILTVEVPLPSATEAVKIPVRGH